MPESSPLGTLILIHGLASNMTRWTEFCQNTQLTQQWRVIRIDLRGHGCSLWRGRVNFSRWISDLRQLIEHEQCQPVVILGHSLGAQLAIHFAHQNPELTRGLILIDPVFRKTLQGTMAKMRRLAPLVNLLSWGSWLLSRLGMYRRQIEYRDLYALDVATRKVLASKNGQNIADLYMSPRADLAYVPTTIYLQELTLVVKALPNPEEIVRPVRVLLSAGGSTSKVDQLRSLISRFPDHQCVELAADHWLLTECPDEAREAIEAFCLGLD